ncbi:unnamed protein product [Notodromas monacha]|uniref:Uncharacterized protein n=1 Tax=Notodromas monacha TaxID=399045 RepID=A0A7R9BL26_9CRUS|nr:unnamed protein product [Notodromas monacha]CAG0917456.1 unnamed protein product [Notodromas monacha]
MSMEAQVCGIEKNEDLKSTDIYTYVDPHEGNQLPQLHFDRDLSDAQRFETAEAGGDNLAFGCNVGVGRYGNHLDSTSSNYPGSQNQCSMRHDDSPPRFVLRPQQLPNVSMTQGFSGGVIPVEYIHRYFSPGYQMPPAVTAPWSLPVVNPGYFPGFCYPPTCSWCHQPYQIYACHPSPYIPPVHCLPNNLALPSPTFNMSYSNAQSQCSNYCVQPTSVPMDGLDPQIFVYAQHASAENYGVGQSCITYSGPVEAERSEGSEYNQMSDPMYTSHPESEDLVEVEENLSVTRDFGDFEENPLAEDPLKDASQEVG